MLWPTQSALLLFSNQFQKQGLTSLDESQIDPSRFDPVSPAIPFSVRLSPYPTDINQISIIYRYSQNGYRDSLNISRLGANFKPLEPTEYACEIYERLSNRERTESISSMRLEWMPSESKPIICIRKRPSTARKATRAA